ncbi:AMP-binding protein [Rhodobacterales bacterium HKCCE2091]|nr:AMP-binding protein [Rhodobacterales bacterium HKCCE2091]
MTAPCPDPFNLASYVLDRGRGSPDKVALAVVGPARAERWSYARLRAAVFGMAGGLSARLAPGSRIMLRLGNTPDFPVAFLSAVAAGMVPVPTSAALTAAEITRLADALPPDLILAGPGIALPDRDVPVVTDLAALMDHAPADPVPGDPDRLAYIVFTSGSSGRPRAVGHAHRAVWARRMMWDGWYGLREDDRLLHAGAFNWTFTLGTGLMDPWAIGATALIPAEGTPAEQIPLLLKRHDASVFAAVPGVYRKILKSGTLLSLPKLRHGLSAGETLPPAIRQAWRDATVTDIHEALGMSECSTYISGSPARPAPEGACGFPQDGRRVAVLDADGGVLPDGETGALAIHRSDPGLMIGYLDGDAAPELPLQGDWFLTGDRVSRGTDGAIRYGSRDDDLMNAGGFRTAPQEVEAAFAGLPGLHDCAAFAADVAPGTRIVALAYEGEADEAGLSARAETALAVYKRPRAYLHLHALPRSANGKLDRKRLPEIWKERQ